MFPFQITTNDIEDVTKSYFGYGMLIIFNYGVRYLL